MAITHLCFGNSIITALQSYIITVIISCETAFPNGPYLLDFLEKIKFSKTLSEYQEKPYLLEKTIAFLDPPRKSV